VDPADGEKSQDWKTPTVNMPIILGDKKWDRMKRYRTQGKQTGGVLNTAIEAIEKGPGHGPTPRTASGIKDRVNRLKAIGNGICPQTAATAWRLLNGTN
jgi:hypothetical protein